MSTDDNLKVCSECLKRGAICVSQEFPEDTQAPGGTHIGERLGRVELLLEKLVHRISQHEEEDNATMIATPESMGCNDIVPHSTTIGVTNDEDRIIAVCGSEAVSLMVICQEEHS